MPTTTDTPPCPLDQACPGDILAAPVRDEAGSVLLPAGQSLTEAHLESLRRRGVSHLQLQAPIAAVDPAELARRREAIHQRVMHLFRHTAGEPGSSALLHAVIRFRQEQCR